MRWLPATIVLLLVLAAPAQAAPTRLGTSISHPVVDSTAGRVVWQPGAGSIRTYDLGSGAPARALGVPAGCEPAGRGALRGDRLVLACAGTDPTSSGSTGGPRLLDLATGASGPVPGAGAAGIGGPDSGVASAGRVWAEGWTRDSTVYFTLDGSAVERGDGAANELPNLDAPELWEPMCAPFRRSRGDLEEDERRWLPYDYSPPLGLGYRRYDYRALRVDRCGRERPLRLSRCKRACAAVHLGAGSVAWRERGRIRLYRGESGRRAHWRARRFGRMAEPFPTRRHVVVTAGSYGAYSLWIVRAPS
jgi:hypothetical protein